MIPRSRLRCRALAVVPISSAIFFSVTLSTSSMRFSAAPMALPLCAGWSRHVQGGGVASVSWCVAAPNRAGANGYRPPAVETRFDVMTYGYYRVQKDALKTGSQMKKTILILLLSILSGCSFFPSYQTPFSVRNPLIDGELEGAGGKTTNFKAEKAQAWIDAYKDLKKTASPTAAQLDKYVGTGITYSQLLCRDYFERLSLTKAHRDHAQKEGNLTGGLVASVMGLAEASAGAIAGTSAAFSFGSASFDAYNESFLVSPNISELESLVQKRQVQEELIIYRKLYLASGNWPDKIASMDQADRALSGYIAICTPNGIRNLVNDSILAKKKTTEAATVVIQQASPQTSPTLLQSVANQ